MRRVHRRPNGGTPPAARRRQTACAETAIGRRRRGALLLSAVVLLAGCTSLRPTDDLSVTVAKGPPPTTAVSPEEFAPSLAAPEETASAGSAVPDEAGPVSSPDASPSGVLKQEEAGLSQPAAAPSGWQSMVRDLSTILRSPNESANGKTLVPDPSDPASSGAADPSSDHPLARLRLDPPKADTSELPEGEPVAAPVGYAPITLNLQGADARQALEMLSSEASVNILVSEGVSGAVTANLRGMTFDEALGAILRLCDLVAHREGNAIFVYPSKDFPQLDRLIRVIPLDYSSAEKVAKSIQEMKGLLSPVGTVYPFVIDDPTTPGEDDVEGTSDSRNTQEAVVVEDSPEYVFRVERYVREVDIPPRQVQIQAYILEVELKNNLTHGVNFDEVIKVAGNSATLRTLGFASTAAFPTPPLPPTGTGFYAKIDGKNFDAILEALKKTTDAKTLANPKVTVLNGQLAHFQVGQRLGYRDTTTQTETAATQSVKFLEVGVVLDVVPRVTADGRVLMTVKPKISDGRVDPVSELPEEETTEVVTNVMLEDSQGMVIGGLIKEKDSDIQGKVPFFGDLPYVGMLFQQRKKDAERSEVIIALLPRVLPYTGCPAAKEQLEVIRATTPLFHGPLRRCPRPWEPTFRDALPQRGDRL